MKTIPQMRAIAAALAIAAAAFTGGCSTYYDSYGRPHQAVDPALAVAGIAAAGLVGYAIAESNDDHHGHGHGYPGGRHGYYGRDYHRGHHHGGYHYYDRGYGGRHGY